MGACTCTALHCTALQCTCAVLPLHCRSMHNLVLPCHYTTLVIFAALPRHCPSTPLRQHCTALHIPSIKDMFGLSSVYMEGVYLPKDDRGFTYATYQPGDILQISGAAGWFNPLDVLCCNFDTVLLLACLSDIE